MSFWRDLGAFGDRPALVTEDGSETSYATLAVDADRWAAGIREQLPAGVRRPLVLLETANAVAPVVAYLGALRAGWPVILSAAGATAADPRIRDIYRPNVLFTRMDDGWRSEIGHDQQIALDAELSVLLSTSGTTGAPKLVRLSVVNLSANAESIAEYLGIGAVERAMTTLPFHYSYGLSVLHTHLLKGASLVLTERSVVEEAFWEAFTRRRATSLALVPVQFDLLDTSGFETRVLPTLKTITQAGGKLAPEAIERYAALARRRGFKLFVMYGQTEAAPRMAYVPPEDLAANTDAIGRAIPGGRFELIDLDGKVIEAPGIAGELVYHGPNVMMGYATSAADLALPQGPAVLHTGDLALRKSNGYYRITGRLSRFVKLFGLRVSLDEIEQRLRSQGIAAYVTGTDERITVFATGDTDVADVQADLAAHYTLPPSALSVAPLDEVPLLASGKVDYRTLAARAASAAGSQTADSGIGEAFAAALRGKTIDCTKSFVEHGGDSLAYLEVQLALTERLGEAPPGWETMPLVALEALMPKPKPAWQLVGVDLVCRNLALLAVIGLHAIAWPIAGGVHVLLMLSGYSLARFQRPKLLQGEVVSAIATMLGPILVAYYAILVAVNFLMAPVDAEWFALLGNFDRDIHPHGITPYWFVCLYAQAVLLIALPFLLPAVRRFAGARPFAMGLVLALGLYASAMVLGLPQALGPTSVRHPVMGLQLLAVGWCVFLARGVGEKAVVTLVAGALALPFLPAGVTAPLFVVAVAAAILWIGQLPVPALLARALMYFGKQSMLVYLAHVLVVAILARLASPSGPMMLAAVIVLSLAAAEAMSRAMRLALR